MKDKTGAYELTRATVHVPCYPKPLLDDLPKEPLPLSQARARLKQGRTYGAASLVTNIDQAEQRGDKLFAKFEKVEKSGNLQDLFKLLHDHPELVLNDEVRDTLLRRGQARRFTPGPGRPRGSFELHPLVVMGLVEELVGRARAKNLEEAFLQLTEMKLSTSYEAAKQAYYSAKNDLRFRAILIKTRSPRDDDMAEHFAERLRRVEKLEPGKSITRPIRTAWGDGQFTLNAVESQKETKA